MPFVKQECRAEGHEACTVGDMCYQDYKRLVDAWNKDPRWTTAHNLTTAWFDLASDADTAHFLAYMVWFMKKVMPYEDLKEKENGTI